MATFCWSKLNIFLILCVISLLTMSESKAVGSFSSVCTKDDPCINRARYDHYRVYNVELESEEHVDLFKKLEEQSDTLSFMGHAREVGQKLTILVAASKIADLTDLLDVYAVKHRILVSKNKKNKMIFSLSGFAFLFLKC